MLVESSASSPHITVRLHAFIRSETLQSATDSVQMPMPEHHVLLLVIGKYLSTGYITIAEIEALMPHAQEQGLDPTKLDVRNLVTLLVEERLMRASIENIYEVTGNGQVFIERQAVA